MWLPTAVNAFIAAEVLNLSWERWRGLGNTAQGEIGPFMHIIAISAPIAVAVLVGWAVLGVLRAKFPRDLESQNHRGVMTLSLINVAAPFLLWFGLKWLT
ncbi:MAG: hypothetical protein M3R58_00110 [Pseudomonadota bacterium]|nr:hypothetical protein [Pseudomonadota bacterium]